MSKFISKCCVCGTVYCVTTTQDNDHEERISHGYCGKGCMNQTPVQIMYWDNDKGCRVLDAGNRAESGRVYFKTEPVDILVAWNKEEKRIDSLRWNVDMYDIAEFELVQNDGHANRMIKEAVQAGHIVIL